MRWSLAICVFLCCGCGTQSNYKSAQTAENTGDFVGDSSRSMDTVRGTLQSPEQAASQSGEAASLTGTPQTGDTTLQRKIIYTARMNIIVKNFDGIEKRVQDAVNEYGGYLAAAVLDRMQGESRMGRWTARIPVDRYDEFLKAIANLGVPTAQDQTAEDVTEEFVDLSARISNKKKLEARILELLDRPDDKIQHVIEVEKELARVLEEIERMEGRIRFLTDQTAMTTVNIVITEQQDYKPPQAPTFSNRIATAWSTSIDRAVEFFEDSVVFLTGNAIAIVVWLVAICLIWLLLGQRIWKRLWHSNASPASTQSDPETQTD